MNWKNELTSIEQKNDWRLAIRLLDDINTGDPEVYLRVMFLLLDLLVEGQYTKEEHDFAENKLKHFFDKANRKFSNNAEFLFFSGIMIYIGEWYFEMDSVEPGTIMLEKAMNMEPYNVLYRWAYYSWIDQRPEIDAVLKSELSKQLLKESQKIDWLRSKGLLGEYVLGMLN